MNDMQDILIVSSEVDAVYVNTKKNEEVDVDELHNIGLIK
jgi:hypothetical protein